VQKPVWQTRVKKIPWVFVVACRATTGRQFYYKIGTEGKKKLDNRAERERMMM